MSVTNQPVFTIYTSDGTTVNYAIAQTYYTETEIKVSKIVGSTETPLVIGSSFDYTLTGAYTGHPLSTQVTLNAPLPAGVKLKVQRQIDLSQPFSPNNSQALDAVALGTQLDRQTGMIQQISDVAGRALTVAQGVAAATGLPAPAANQFLAWNSAGTAIVNVPGGGALGVPTDGAYGGVNGPIAGVAVGDTNENAFDKVETVLGKLAPAKPPLLSSKSLSITGTFTALESGTGTTRTNVVTNTTPVVSWGGTVVSTDGAYDPESGTITAEIDTANSGTITLSSADDSATIGQLQVQYNSDYYAGVSGKAGFWSALIARIIPTALALGIHTARIKSTGASGSTPLLTFFVDDSGTPTVSAGDITSSAGTSRISGVPALRSGDAITVLFTVGNAIKTYYNATRIASENSPYAVTASAALPGTPPANGASFAASIPTTIANNVYVETLQVTGIGYAANGTQGSAVVQKASGIMRVDSKSSESTRLSSGTGQYPTTGYGSAWVSTDLLSSNKELQMLGGFYQYPALVDYSTNYPVAGPNNTGLTSDSYASMRWATFSLGTVSSASSISFAINSAVNFGGSTLVSGIALYVKVQGTTGWLDANAAYPGTGSPSADGDGALDVGSSTSTAKRVTFGATVRSGTVYVRIGIPSGSTKTFGSIS